MINKTNNQEYVSKLKKTYSTLAQATNLIIAEEGIPQADKGGWATTSENVYNLYKKFLHNAKECGINSGCFVQPIYTLNKDSSRIWDSSNYYRRFVLADGVQVLLTYPTADCSLYDSYCDEIYVDINGERKPNTLGLDVFLFYLTNKGLVPSGCETNDCSRSQGGWFCACKVLREGAINY